MALAPSAVGQANPVIENPFADSTAKPFEVGAQVQGGVGVTGGRGNFSFLNAGVHAGKVIAPLQFRSIKANFEYGVEVIPFWQSYTPRFQRANCVASTVPIPGGSQPAPGVSCSAPFSTGGTYTGVSITPIILRLNLTGGKKVVPFIQGAGGVIWTNHKYPAFPDGASALTLANDGPGSDASVWNFTPQFGVGLHYFVKPRRSIDFEANAIHISSASIGDKNPGVNATVQFQLGYSWWK